MIDLLERKHAVTELTTAKNEALAGLGSVTVVHGEAGVGKSSLIAACRQRWGDSVRVLVGLCDDLATPRALGPLRDLTPYLGEELAQALRADDRESVFTALRAEFGRGGAAAVLVIEDVHWADDATLDVLHFLIRRIATLPLALVLTHRDEPLAGGHRLRLLLGRIATAERLHRIQLQPLSLEAVRVLSATSLIDARWLHTVTSGNPFFVSEVLKYGAGSDSAPPTVIDAVLARTHQLGERPRTALEQLAVIPSVVEWWLVHALVPGEVKELPAAEQAGLIVATPEHLSFRHELTRRAIADSMPSARRVELHGRALAVLAARTEIDPSRLVHHAIGAGDVDAIVRYGRVAADDARRAGAHREAVAHYREVLAYRKRLSAAELAGLLEGYADECQTTADITAACTALLEAVELRRAGHDRRALGEALRRLSRAQLFSGSDTSPQQAASEAIEVLTNAGDSRLLAMACSHQAQLHLLSSENSEALRYGERAVALARSVDDPAVLSNALNNLGSTQWSMGDSVTGQSTLEASLRVALDSNQTSHACSAYNNLTWGLLDDLRLAEARQHIEAIIKLAEAAEELNFLGNARAFQALQLFYTGDWEAAQQTTESSGETRSLVAQWLIALVRSRIAVRRGLPSADDLLAAVPGSGRIKDLHRIGLLASARAEAAWLRADFDAVIRHVEPTYEWAGKLGHRRWQHELGYWLVQAGRPVDPHDSLGPYESQRWGRFAKAAASWQAADMPYEQAMALAQSDGRDDLMAALSILDRLGAQPLARYVREKLRSQGVSGIPRGPNGKTRGNPGGLTHRQIEIARLLACGWSNAQIARSLVVSVRTVENHVAAVLSKLGTGNRQDVADRMRELGIDER